MMKKKSHILSYLIVSLTIVGISGTTTIAANRYSVANNNWNNTATWSTTSGGGAGASVPVAGDAVIIEGGHTVTVTADAACTSITYTAAAVSNTLIINSGITLTVSGAIAINRPSATTNTNLIAVGAGNLSCTSMALSGTNTANRITTVSIATGNVTISGNITSAGTSSNLIFTGAGTLNVGGTFMSGTAGTFTAGTGTINYNGAGAQIIGDYTYNNLTLSGGGVKTEAAATVNGVLSIEGTSSISGAPTYGAAVTLQYKTTDAHTAGAEWTANFAGTGGIIIANTAGSVAMNSAEVVNAPIAINSGATFVTNNFALTFGGDFVNSGGTFTAGSSNITISGVGATQSIDGITTTGTVAMTKTGGTATLQNVLSSGALTLNGAGTLNLGTALTHSILSITFTNGTLNLGSSTVNVAGAVALTAGALNLGSGTLNLTGNFSGAGTLTGGTGTMNFNGSSAQTAVGKTTYNIVKINNAAGVTLTSTATIPTLTIGDEIASSVFYDGGFQVTSTGTLNLISGILNLGSAAATTWPAFTAANIASGTTVGYTASVAQIVSSTPSYQNLTYSGAGTKTIAAGNTVIVGGNWTVGSAATLTTTANATVTGDITGAGAITMGSGTLTVGGNWTQSGGFTQGTGTVNYNGNTADQIVRGGITYYNLQISNGSSKLLQAGAATVSGVLTLNSGVFKIGDNNLILNNTTIRNLIADTL